MEFNIISAISFSLCHLLFSLLGKLASDNRGLISYLFGEASPPSWAIGLSAGVTSLSGLIMIGTAGAGYLYGVSALIFPLCWLAGDLIFWSFFPKKIAATARNLTKEKTPTTIPDILSLYTEKNRGGNDGLRFSASIVIIFFISIYIVGQQLAAEKILTGVLPLSREVGLFIIGALLSIYCVRGSFKSSLLSNIVQAVFVFLLVLFLVIYCVFSYGGIGHFVNELEAINPGLLSFFPNGFNIWDAVLILGFLSGPIGFGLSAPHFIFRLVASKSPEDAARAKWTYIGFLQTIWLGMTCIGIMVRVIIPDISDPELAFSIFTNSQLSAWFSGVVLAAVFGVIISVIDAQIMVIISTFLIDFLPALTKRKYYSFNKRFAFFIIWGFFFISIFVELSVYELIIFSGVALSTAFTPAMLLVMCNIKTGMYSMAIVIIVGMIMAILWKILEFDKIIFVTIPGALAALVVHQIYYEISLKRNI